MRRGDGMCGHLGSRCSMAGSGGGCVRRGDGMCESPMVNWLEGGSEGCGGAS